MKLMNLDTAKASPTEELVAMLLNGNILSKLAKDFDEMRTEDSSEYMEYIEENWRKYVVNSFALYKGYRFDIVSTGVLALESLVNRSYPHLELNDHLGFWLVDTEAGSIIDVNSYDDIVRVLGGRRDD